LGTFKFFKMHLRVPFLLLALLEFCICIFAVFVAVYVRFDGTQITQVSSISSPVATSVLFGLVMPVTMMAMGLYQSRFRGGIIGVFLRSVIGFLSGAAILALLYYLIPPLKLGRGVFALAILIAFFMVGTIRPMFFYYMDRDILKIRVLVLGAGEKASSITRRLRRRVDRRGFRVVGYVPLPNDTGTKVDPSLLADIDDRSLLDYAIAENVDEIVVAADERRGGLPLDQLLECKVHGLDIIDLLSFFEREQGKLPLDILRPDWLIYSDGFARGTFREITKRAFDVIASILILAITWPFMQYAVKNDARVTRVGQFIRNTRIDELPQILNVLNGDMSFVGPRPERPHFVDQLSESIDYYRERHAVKPGITGWAQVCYPYGASHEDSVQKH